MANKNIPFTGDEVKNLKIGFTESGKFPNHSQRRQATVQNPVPNSTKMGAGSINSNMVYRTNKHKPQNNTSKFMQQHEARQDKKGKSFNLIPNRIIEKEVA